MTSRSRFIRVYAPEFWGQVDKFKEFYEKTHDFKSHEKKAVAGINNHFQKAVTLLSLAKKLAPNLQLDNDELATRGHTAAENAKEFAAVIEGVFTELYSCVDCTHTVIHALYKKCRRMPDSTRNFFERAVKGEFGSDFPEQILSAVLAATWYNELRVIRDELTHSTTGNAYLDSATTVISYMHHGVQRNKAPLLIKDVFKKIDELASGVNKFLGQVFHFLNAGLEAKPVDVICGFSFDRVYVRKMVISEHVDFNSGTCQSNQWFDAEPDRRCPFASNCGAYARAMELADAPPSPGV